jgi:DegV family protein with EDD domain
MNGQSYRDNVDLTREDFYQQLPSSNPHPTTSAPGVDIFVALYQSLISDGADHIISIHISKSLSNVCNVAELAAREINQPEKVTVIDSGQLSLGLGLIVRAAAMLARQSIPLSEIIPAIQDIQSRTYAYARLNTLEYLRRGGRLSNIKHTIASLLDMKPIMKMVRGVAKMEAVRTRRRAEDRLVELVEALGPLEQIGFTHFNAREEVDQLMERLRSSFPANFPLLIQDVTPSLGAHVGPGAVCVSCVAKHQPGEESINRFSDLTRRIRSFTG